MKVFISLVFIFSFCYSQAQVLVESGEDVSQFDWSAFSKVENI